MQPVDTDRRHCAQCDRVIVDFTQMSDDELMLYFRHTKGKLCGKLSSTQLNRAMPLIPEPKVSRSWWKALCLLPLALFARKADAQDRTPLKKIPRSMLFQRNDTIPNEAISTNDSTVNIATTDTVSTDTMQWVADTPPIQEITTTAVGTIIAIDYYGGIAFDYVHFPDVHFIDDVIDITYTPPEPHAPGEFHGLSAPLKSETGIAAHDSTAEKNSTLALPSANDSKPKPEPQKPLPLQPAALNTERDERKKRNL